MAINKLQVYVTLIFASLCREREREREMKKKTNMTSISSLSLSSTAWAKYRPVLPVSLRHSTWRHTRQEHLLSHWWRHQFEWWRHRVCITWRRRSRVNDLHSDATEQTERCVLLQIICKYSGTSLNRTRINRKIA